MIPRRSLATLSSTSAAAVSSEKGSPTLTPSDCPEGLKPSGNPTPGRNSKGGGGTNTAAAAASFTSPGTHTSGEGPEVLKPSGNRTPGRNSKAAAAYNSGGSSTVAAAGGTDVAAGSSACGDGTDAAVAAAAAAASSRGGSTSAAVVLSGKGSPTLTPGEGPDGVKPSGNPTPGRNSEDGTTVPDATAGTSPSRSRTKKISSRASKESAELFKFDDVADNNNNKQQTPEATEYAEYLKYRFQYEFVGEVDGNDLEEIPEEPPKGQPNSCCVFAGAKLAGTTIAKMRQTLRDAFFDTLSSNNKYGGIKDWNVGGALGFPEKDHYHVSLLVKTLANNPYYLKLTKVPSTCLRRKFWKNKRQTLLVIGQLNFKFKPWKWLDQKNNTYRWNCPDCKKANFGGLGKIEGEHDDLSCHTVVVNDGRLHCANLISQQNNLFAPAAVKLLPTKKGEDGQYRIVSSNKLAYLSNIRRVFLVENELPPDNNSRYEINVSKEVFTIGMIDLPQDFTVENFQSVYKKIFTKGYRPPCKSAPMSILGSTVFPTLQSYAIEGVYVPRLNKHSRVDSEGWQSLKLPSLVHVAKAAEKELIAHLRMHDKATLQKVLLFQHLVPDKFRVCGTVFNSVALVGNLENGENHKHRDEEDLCSIIITLGKDVSGGRTLYWEGDKVIHAESFRHGKFQVGPFEKIFHSGERWTGPRGVLSFYINRKMYEHFWKHDNTLLKIYYENKNLL